MRRLAAVLLVFGCVLSVVPRLHAAAVGTAFTYQGTLHQSGSPLTGSVDLQFSLHDALTAGTQVGVTQTVNGVNVANGVFTVTLDFGNVFNGTAAWLQVSVKNAGGGAFTLLAPRQALTAAPYALYALSGPGGGGSLTLPFSGAIARQGSTANNDAVAGLAPFAVTNSATTGVSHGLIGRTSSSWQNATGVLGVGAATTGATSGVQGYATGSSTGTGVVGVGGANGGYFRGGDGAFAFERYGVIGTVTESAEFPNATGVLGSVDVGTGVEGRAIAGVGVVASSTANYGLRASTFSGAAAVLGQNENGYGVQGVTGFLGAGVQGLGGAYGRGVEGVANAEAGVVGSSQTGRGVEGYSNVQSGVFGSSQTGRGIEGIATNPVGVGGYFRNTVGGVALFADGFVKVKTLQILGGADLAEPFDVASTHEAAGPGCVVVIDPAKPGDLRVSERPYDTRVAGIISGANDLAPGMVMQSEGQPGAHGAHPVALTGRVWCKADASAGAIRPGDLLTSSSTPGHAMKAVDPGRRAGAVIGKAMTCLESGTGLVLVLVSLQ